MVTLSGVLYPIGSQLTNTFSIRALSISKYLHVYQHHQYPSNGQLLIRHYSLNKFTRHPTKRSKEHKLGELGRR